MDTKPKKLIVIFAIVFLALISINMISANEIDHLNGTSNSQISPDSETTDFDGDEIYVKHDVEVSGNGSYDHPYKTIKEAVNTANAGKKPATIFIHAGTYEEIEMEISNSLVIKSYDGEVTLDANNNGWFFYSSKQTNYLSLHGLTFKNGINYDDSDSTVGGVVRSEGHLDVVNCTFENNFGGTGGGINSHNGANIINSTFKNNKAEYNGAAAYVLNGQTNIINCTFTNNTAKRQGGALRIQGDTYIEKSIFENNAAALSSAAGGNYAGNGGAVRVTDGNLTIESSIFRNNSAKYEGGAVSAGDDSQYSTVHYALNINNSTFTGNSARHGGAIIANDGINMANSTVADNYVPYTITARYGQGSGIYVLRGDSILIGNNISNNTNQYNRDAVDVYTYEGNIVERGNSMGPSSKITANNGKLSNEITQNPTIIKPQIVIQHGKSVQKSDNTANIPKNNNEKDSNQNPVTETNDNHNPNQDHVNENKGESNLNEENNIKENLDTSNSQNSLPIHTSSNSNKNNAENIENAVRTNSSTSEIRNEGNLGDKSELDNGESSQNDASARELSPIKSIISNEYTVPATIIVLIMFLAFVIGYLRKRKDD
ncbi:hypothetical protein [Methanobrevibacter sp. UBA212]|uniref:hypothetical protein n=1 Tax=Methanobrevibacter sp. UBA212 TaxID=1915476 RepID=UPI0025EAB4E4|nr:hypothetical protein [Methanobrevibacter sp. UBA212]